MLRRTRILIVVVLAGAAGLWPPVADAASVSKPAARAYIVDAVPKGAARVMLGDARAEFFRTERLWVQRADGCRRRSAVVVSCRFVARLVPDGAHRKRNWWPISCRGSVLVERMGDGRLVGTQRDYVCRTLRP